MIQKRRSLFFPVLLVGLGVFLLLNNLGVVTGSVNEILRTYWPLILILGGLDALYRRDGWVWALVLLGLGTILLLGNLNYMPTRALPLLVKIWPILLVAIGLDIAFGGRSSAWYALLRVFIGIILVGMILWMAISSTTTAGLQQQNYQQDLDGAESSRVEFSVITGRLRVHPGTDATQLLSGSAALPNGVVFEPAYAEPKNGKSALSYKASQNGIVLDATSINYEFELNPAIPIRLDTELVVGEMDLDLAGTAVNELKTEMALGRQQVHLPCDRLATVTLEAAVADLEVYIPQGCDVTINLENGLTYTSLPEGYQRSGNVVNNANAVERTGPLEVTIELAVGAVSIHEE